MQILKQNTQGFCTLDIFGVAAQVVDRYKSAGYLASLWMCICYTNRENFGMFLKRHFFIDIIKISP